MKNSLKVVLTAILVLSSFQIFAQGGPPCGAPFFPNCPIDGGVSFLIAAGLAFGGKKAHDMSKKKR